MTIDFSTKITMLTNQLIKAEKGSDEYDSLLKQLDWLIASNKQILKLGIAIKQLERLEMPIAGESRRARLKRVVLIKIVKFSINKRIRKADEELKEKTLELLFTPKR